MFDAMENLKSGQQLERLVANIPDELPILPLRNTVAFPFAVIPLAVGVPRSVQLVEETIQGDRLIGMVASYDPEIDTPMPGEMYEVGTVGLIHRVVRSPEDDTLSIVVQGLERFKITEWTQQQPYLKAHIDLAPDIADESVETEALRRNLVDVAKEVVELMPGLPQGVSNFLDQVDDSRYLIYLVAANTRMEVKDAQHLIELDTINEKMRMLISHLTREKEVLALGQKISEEAQEEMSKQQREYYLRQQLEAIRRELGESDEQDEVERYRQRIAEVELPEDARKEADRELGRLAKMPPQAPEYSVIKTYLDWLLDLPWNTFSEDNLDIENARKVLDEDHYDLQEVKDRILEYLAVRKLARDRDAEIVEAEEDESKREEAQKILQESAGAILCFVGPPGVGKTSLGQSIARALGRKFTRMSLGGMRDEAEIRGHRRTYIGAMPGRIIQAIKRTGTRNPVFMLDEVDKIGSDWRGDPSSALLEVLDPQQNHTFRDHYLDVDFDLSDVIFITTANQLETIPAPLRDRMETLRIDGYTEHEKVCIAESYLVPRQRRANRLRQDEIGFTEAALRLIINEYTREAGVRNLEREIGTVCRKVAVQVAAGEEEPVEVTPDLVREFLGKPKVFPDAALRTEVPGVATGLAWTPVGGDVLFIEVTRMRGKGGLTITGHLGKVMEESVRIAYSYARAKALEWGLDEENLEKSDFHVHVPEGAIPKDGPSAGVAMLSAMTSLLIGQPVRAEVGMTGEITLRGQVLPIGGVKHKVLAAHRAGLKTVILPKRNEADLDELPEDVRDSMDFVLVERMDEVLEAALRSDDEDNGAGSANGHKREAESAKVAVKANE